MEVECCVPPGFRFHPTEEELVGYYLARKVASQKIDLGVINDVDLYRIEPWDLQERCKLGYEGQNEWYFFSHKDKKYPSGTRTNRATNAGFWKATGRDKAVLSKLRVIGMRKTLVFYEGRAPNGRKSDWIMHEYRLQSSEHGPTQEEGWVVCRAFKKPTPNPRPYYNTYFNIREHNQVIEPTCIINGSTNFYEQPLGILGELHHDPKVNCNIFEIPRLDSPISETSSKRDEYSKGKFVDWKVLDNLLASQFIDESASCSTSNLPTLDQYDMNDPSWMN